MDNTKKRLTNSERLLIFAEDHYTGELRELDLTNYVVIDKEEVQRLRKLRKQYVEKENQIELRSDNHFIWGVYHASTLLLDQLPGNFVSMIFYLATFCGYQGYLTTGKALIHKENLKELLGVSRTTLWRFWEALSQFGICKEEDDKRILLNKEFFRRGKIKKKELATMAAANMYATRLYVDTIRSLYQKVMPYSKKTLCYLFMIIPFLNREYNVVCYNPLEKDFDKIEPMNLGEFCRTIGYNEKNSARLLAALQELKFIGKNGEESAMRYTISDRFQDRSEYNLFINPNVLYAGSHWDEVSLYANFNMNA